GKLLVAKPYTKVTWATGVGLDGKPITVPDQGPTADGRKTCPGMSGGHNWQPTAYSPQTGLYYFSSADGCQMFYKMPQAYVEGQWFQASTVSEVPGEHTAEGSIVAINPATGETKWRFQLVSPPSAGILATGGGLVFSGDQEGYFFALDARTGRPLWHFQTGG